MLGWTRDGALATFTMSALGRGEVLVERTPPLRIPVKDKGLCGSAPRWSCRLALDPAHPEQPGLRWLETVRQDLSLIPPVAGPPPSSGERIVYPVPGGFWAVEISDDPSGLLPVVELVLRQQGSELRYLVWQATFGLDADEPLQLLWHPRRPLGAVLARSADRPFPLLTLVARLDLARPITVEEQALERLAAVLQDRPGAAVRLAALLEEVRSRSQRRAELGAILLDSLGEGCLGGGDLVVLDAHSFDWSEIERGALLTWGCPQPRTEPAAARLLLAHTLHRREHGVWQKLRSFPRVPGPAAEVELRELDLTSDGYPELWVRESGDEQQGSFAVLGWRAGQVDSLLLGSYAARCTQLSGGSSFVEGVAIADPEKKGVAAMVVQRVFFAQPGPSCRLPPPAAPLQEELLVWRWNTRLKRFYRRHQVVAPPGARPIPLPGEGKTASATAAAATSVKGGTRPASPSGGSRSKAAAAAAGAGAGAAAPAEPSSGDDDAAPDLQFR
ncbi:MAG: hypothetical protein FJ125_13525 [Deltaproteobacteria bacterium]|nr:hypothetical protein [Deltaproteobacteria bacterium]